MIFQKPKLSLLLLLFLVPLAMQAQKKKKVKKEPRRYPMTFLSAAYGQQSSQLFLNKNYLLYGIFDENIGYKGSYTWNATVQYGKAFDKKMDILVGMSHDRHRIIQTKGFDYVPCSPERFGATKIESAERIVKMNRIEIPVDFRYHFRKKNFSFAPSFGAGLAFYNARNQRVKMLLDNGRIGENAVNDDLMQQTRGLNVTATIKLGMVYDLDKDLSIKIEPFYKHYIVKEPILDGYKRVNPLGVGVMFGIEHTLSMAEKKQKVKKMPRK